MKPSGKLERLKQWASWPRAGCHGIAAFAQVLLILLCTVKAAEVTPLAPQGVQPLPWDISAWILTVGGQTVHVNPDGTFTVPNISAPDRFGAGGPGTAPDFLSDDFLRLTGINTAGPVTWYCFSDPFQVRSGETYQIAYLSFTTFAPPFPQSIRLAAERPTITQLEGANQLTVTARLSDGSDLDVTKRERWTIYRTSNPKVATIDINGLVIGHQRGTVFITAVNEGATAVTEVDVVPSGELTTVTGVVQDHAGVPAPGINVFLAGVAGSATTKADGSFSVPNVSAEFKISGVIARGTLGANPVFGRTGPLQTVPSGLTDAGIIVVRPCQEIGLDCTDTDNDCLPDSLETRLRLNPLLPDTDGDGIPDGEEDTDNDGIPNCTEVLLGTDPGSADTDKDGLSDWDEIYRFGTDPTNADSDFDGLNDGAEISAGTDPLKWDTDGDGFDDSTELHENMDPLVPDSGLLREIASSTISFLNAQQDEPPKTVSVSVASRLASYLNAEPNPVPRSVLVSIASPSVSYLNGLFEVGASTRFVISPLVSYRNGAAALQHVSGLNQTTK